MPIPSDRRFFSTTRGQVVLLLRRGSHTVEELARKLGLTDNAVRAHLTTLERDGLVQQAGLRRSGGKPAFAYNLTAAAEQLFPKAYGPVLAQLLDVLQERLPPQTLEDFLREAGHRLATAHLPPDAAPPARLAHALALLNELGGLAEVEAPEGALFIQGYSCPLAGAVPDHPEICRLVETLLADLLAAPVRERCDRRQPPRCRFEIGTAGNSDSRQSLTEATRSPSVGS